MYQAPQDFFKRFSTVPSCHQDVDSRRFAVKPSGIDVDFVDRVVYPFTVFAPSGKVCKPCSQEILNCCFHRSANFYRIHRCHQREVTGSFTQDIRNLIKTVHDRQREAPFVGLVRIGEGLHLSNADWVRLLMHRITAWAAPLEETLEQAQQAGVPVADDE